MIHNSSVIDKKANIGKGVKIGPFCNIGPKVQIGGASGVISDLTDNLKVMGYPAVPMREFIKLRKKN